MQQSWSEFPRNQGLRQRLPCYGSFFRAQGRGVNRERGEAHTMMGYWVGYHYWQVIALDSARTFWGPLWNVPENSLPRGPRREAFIHWLQVPIDQNRSHRTLHFRSWVLSTEWVSVGAPGRNWDVLSADPEGVNGLNTAAQRWPQPSWNQSLHQWLEGDMSLRRFSRGYKRYPKHLPNNKHVLTILDIGCRDGLGGIGRTVMW